MKYHKPRASEENIKELNKEIGIATLIGGLQGALLSVPTALYMRKRSAVYRNVRAPLRILFHLSFICAFAIFNAESQLLVYKQRDYQREMKRREDVLNEAADRGIFLEEDMLAKEGGQ